MQHSQSNTYSHEYESVVILPYRRLSGSIMIKETGYLFETGIQMIYTKMKYVIENYDNQAAL